MLTDLENSCSLSWQNADVEAFKKAVLAVSKTLMNKLSKELF